MSVFFRGALHTAAWLLFAVPAVAEPGTVVTCVADFGYHCENKNGCVDDARFLSTYRIDWAAGSIIQTSVQHTKRDPSPRPDDTEYVIIKVGKELMTGEVVVTAFGQTGLSTYEIILLGERSYLASSVSELGPRVAVLTGKCVGLKPPQ